MLRRLLWHSVMRLEPCGTCVLFVKLKLSLTESAKKEWASSLLQISIAKMESSGFAAKKELGVGQLAIFLN